MPADFTYVRSYLAVGGGIFTPEAMREVAQAGFTHIIDCQSEFDDTPVAEPHHIKVLWLPLFDNFAAPDYHEFDRVKAFIQGIPNSDAINPKYKLHVHCAAGCRRGPMVASLALGLLGEDFKTVLSDIQICRPITDLTKTYIQAVEHYIAQNKRG